MTTYGHSNLIAIATTLPETWNSRLLAQVGGANLKIVRMDAAGYKEECHGYDEVLLVLNGQMDLVVKGDIVTVHGGEIYVVPAGVPHSVAPGSYGTLLIMEP